MKRLKDKLLRGSIKYKLVIASTVLIAFTVFLCWFVMKVYLIRYYEATRVDLLGNTYSEINAIYNSEFNDIFDDLDIGVTDDGILYYDYNIIGKAYNKNQNIEEVALTFERLSTNQNMSLYIFDIRLDRQNILLDVNYPLSSSLTSTQKEILSNRVREFYTDDSNNLSEKNLLKSEKQYNVYRVYDDRIKSNYIELFGKLENGSTIYIRTNITTIQESVSVAIKFLAYGGFFATLIGIVIMYFISRSFTRPILELSDIAKRISDLDFEAKYDVKTGDEIGTLGTSINSLSEKLETTISELKSANNELQTDIQHKIEIDELRKDFLSNVSHELKTPIALIQGYAEGLKENVNEDEEGRDFYCEVIMDEAGKMNKLVRKLLTLNQIEFGNNQVNIERFDIVTLIRLVVASSDILFKQKNIIFQFTQTEPIYVWADEYMVEEVVTNYISNAINHVDDARTIKVSFVKKDGVVRVSIFNTGNNIPTDELDNVWIKFYKIDKARTREYGGSGIGLSIVKAIMTSLNQECGIVNHNKGVEFWFELDSRI